MKPGKRSFTEKLQDDKDLPKVEPIASEHEGRWGKGTMLIAAPREVDALMCQVRRGELTTLDEVRRALAARHRATTTCPLTTGIFANLAAHAAEEQAAAGKQRVTPYWRTLKAGGELNPKFPGGVEVLRSRLVAEGHVVAARGKRLFVVDHEHKLARLVAK
jgi:hypothetical protein